MYYDITSFLVRQNVNENSPVTICRRSKQKQTLQRVERFKNKSYNEKKKKENSHIR